MADSTTLVIFGASGDLTQRKLIPALFNLRCKQRLPTNLQIVGVASTALSDADFRAHLRAGVDQFAVAPFTESEWNDFAARLFYRAGSFTDFVTFARLAQSLGELERGAADRLYYLATPPQFFADIVAGLGRTGMTDESAGWRRVVIEKPFGNDLASARALNQQLHRTLDEKQIYRIDHYLGKETVQNILVSRFANMVYEPLWNRNYIDHVQITVAEEVGVEHRAGYYDGVGVLRDMFQNHLLQLLSLVAMEPPASFDADVLREKKVDVLKAIRPIAIDQVKDHTVRGQYLGYRDEAGVAPDSQTETYAALRLFIDNWRWQGVPFYLRSGKRMTDKATEIVIQFKQPPHLMFPMSRARAIAPNVLTLCLQPDEGIHLQTQAKVPDTLAELRAVDLEFHYRDSFSDRAIPEAYERLLLDALNGDASLFTRGDRAEIAWSLLDPIIAAWHSPDAPPLAIYEPGSWGPVEADEFITRDGRMWLHGCGRHAQ
ncbi:MAG: glucose-6-phosphate dehydrogenase [Anaerolineales bacterium]|nr:glucose-6-phosphate dehydrogenase [Anaerolineales bacterium]